MSLLGSEQCEEGLCCGRHFHREISYMAKKNEAQSLQWECLFWDPVGARGGEKPQSLPL